MPPSEFFVGVDLGQAQDYTALAVLQRVPPPQLQHGQPAPPQAYGLRHLERPALGTAYPAIVARVGALLATPMLKGQSVLVVDQTGVGRAVVDLLREAKLAPVPVTITGGSAVTRENGAYRVPKRDLVGALLVLLQTKRLRVAAGLAEWPALAKELLAFRMTINVATGHDSYEAWREGAHDDLVLAAALAAWYAESHQPVQLVAPVGLTRISAFSHTSNGPAGGGHWTSLR